MHVTFVTEQTFDENFSRGAKPELQNPAERPSRAGGAPLSPPTRARVTRVTRMYAHVRACTHACTRTRIRAYERTYVRASFILTRASLTHHAHTYTHHIHTSHSHITCTHITRIHAHISCAPRHAYHVHTHTLPTHAHAHIRAISTMQPHHACECVAHHAHMN